MGRKGKGTEKGMGLDREEDEEGGKARSALLFQRPTAENTPRLPAQTGRTRIAAQLPIPSLENPGAAHHGGPLRNPGVCNATFREKPSPCKNAMPGSPWSSAEWRGWGGKPIMLKTELRWHLHHSLRHADQCAQETPHDDELELVLLEDWVQQALKFCWGERPHGGQ